MRSIPPPREVIGESVLALWRQSAELSSRFPDNEAGVHQFAEYVRRAVNQCLELERNQKHV